MKSLVKIIFIVTLQLVTVSCISISPKLDFDEQSELIQVRKEITGKIKGLKVTVDTSELKESKSSGSESSTSSESGEKKKTVGVRTDVTFELTSGEDRNETKTYGSGNKSDNNNNNNKNNNNNDDDDNASIVPVFKGKPARGDNPTPGNKPQTQGYPPAIDDPNRRVDNDYPQYIIWTTERNHRRPIDQQPPVHFHRGSYENNFQKPSNFIPYHINRHHPFHRPIRPCDCKEYPGPYIRPPSSSEENHHQKVDDKLDRPFSKTSD